MVSEWWRQLSHTSVLTAESRIVSQRYDRAALRRPWSNACSPILVRRAAMRFIRPGEVLKMIGVSRTTLWRMVRGGVFPPPIRITKRNTGYILDDVEGWMLQR